MSNAIYRMEFVWWIPVENASEEEEQAWRDQRPRLEQALRLDCDDFIFQLERGEESKRLHYQGNIKLKTKERLATIGNRYKDEFPGISFRIASTAGERALKNYCMKEETRDSGPWSMRPIEPPKKFRGWQLDKAQVYADVVNNPRPFQSALTRMVEEVPDDRTIVWVADEKGNTGKSKWARYMASVHGAEWHTYGKSNDIINVVCDREASGLYIFNLPRARPKDAAMCDLFATLEMIKDGYIVNYKYKGAVVERPHPHLVVLANYLPEFGAEGTSRNRYKFYFIDHNFELKPVAQEASENVE